MFGIKNSTTFFAYCNVVAVGYDKICSEPNRTNCTRTLNTELGVLTVNSALSLFLTPTPFPGSLPVPDALVDTEALTLGKSSDGTFSYY